MKAEQCQLCDSPTGRAGEDSIYIDASDNVTIGPLCEECLNGIVHWVASDAGISPNQQALAAKDAELATTRETIEQLRRNPDCIVCMVHAGLKKQLAVTNKRIKQLETFGVCPKCSAYVFSHTTCDRCGAEAVPSVIEVEIAKLVQALADANMQVDRLLVESEGWRKTAKDREGCIKAHEARIAELETRHDKLEEDFRERGDEIVTRGVTIRVMEARIEEMEGRLAVHGFTLIGYLLDQIKWSRKTFGDGKRTLGIVQHIRKELTEIEASPTGMIEWLDVVILALDGAWRAGYDPGQIIDGLKKKQAINFARQWPLPGPEDQANEHVRDALNLQPGTAKADEEVPSE